MRTTIPDCCRQALFSAGVLSTLIALLSALVLDFGDVFRVNVMAVLLFWAWVAWAIHRRPEQLTTGDLWIMRYGLLPFVVCFFVAVQVVWRIRGFS